MTEDKLIELIAGGETLTVEFKGEKREGLNDADLVLAAVCMANASGGHILVGVEDDRVITGARRRHLGGTDVNKIRALIRSKTMPNLETAVHEIIVDGKPILSVYVPQSPLTSNSLGTCVRRVISTDGKPACVPYYPHEQVGRDNSLGLDDLTARVCDAATWSDLDPIQFERVRRTIAARSGDKALLELSDEDLAKALGAVETKEGRVIPCFSGLLIFGKEEALRKHIPTHEAMFQVLTAGADVRVNDSFRKPLVELAEQIEERFRARVEEREMQVGLIRLPIPDFAFGAFREALLNALFHRSYRENNAVYVQWRPDRLEITSPGGFPDGVTTANLLTHEPKPRNRRLYEIAKRIGLVEQTGRGVDKVYLGQLRYGRPIPDYSKSDSTGVRLILRGGDESMALAAYVFERERKTGPISVKEMIAINKLFHERRITSAALAVDIQAGQPEARSVLERLVEEGLVQPKGEGRGRVYHFSAAVYSALGSPGAHRRVHGMEPTEQEITVLELLKSHDLIARHEVMERCGIGSTEATRLLSKMVRKGVITPQGNKRGRKYKLPDNQA